MNLEIINQYLGDPGRYHICIFLLVSFNYVAISINHLAMAVYGVPVKLMCFDNTNSFVDNETSYVDSNALCQVNKTQLEKTRNCSHLQYTEALLRADVSLSHIFIVIHYVYNNYKFKSIIKTFGL